MSDVNSQDYHCPKCREIDRVEKVSAFFEAGTAAGVYTSTGLPVVTQTVQSSKLTPPSEPLYQSPWGCFSVGFIFLSTAALIYFIYALITATPEQKAHPTVGGIIVYLLIIGIGAAILIVNISTARKRKEAWILAHPRWEHAIGIWSRLYYCSRDDIVFLPEEPKVYVTASQMATLLYEGD